MYHTKELVVSFDGFSLFLSKRQNSQTWLHIDQHPTDPLYSIQGAYNFFPVGEEDAGFIVVPGSHRTYNALNVEKRRKFIMISKNQSCSVSCTTLASSLLLAILSFALICLYLSKYFRKISQVIPNHPLDPRK